MLKCCINYDSRTMWVTLIASNTNWKNLLIFKLLHFHTKDCCEQVGVSKCCENDLGTVLRSKAYNTMQLIHATIARKYPWQFLHTQHSFQVINFSQVLVIFLANQEWVWFPHFCQIIKIDFSFQVSFTKLTILNEIWSFFIIKPWKYQEFDCTSYVVDLRWMSVAY